MILSIVHQDSIPLYTAILSVKYKKSGYPLVKITVDQNSFAFYALFAEMDETMIVLNPSTVGESPNAEIKFIDLDELKPIPEIRLNPKYKSSMLGLPVIPNSYTFFSYHNRLKYIKMPCEQPGFISSSTVFAKIPSIELNQLQSIPTEPQISSRIVKMIQNRFTIKSKTALVVGGPGCGKTTFLKYLIKNVKQVKQLDLVLFSSQLEFDSSEHIDDIFSLEDGVIVIDDIDILNAHPRATSNVVEKIQKSQNKPIVIIATSRSSPYALQSELASVFETSVTFGALSYHERLNSLQNVNLSDKQKEFIAKETAGSSRGEFNTAVRVISNSDFSEEKFINLMRTIATSEKPMMLRQSSSEVPLVCGYKTEQKEIKLILDVTFNGDENKHRMLQYNGILLHGPSGNGKSLIVKKMAAEFEVPFFVVEFDKIFSKYLGDSEKAIRDVFSAARFFAPSVVVIEDIDALGGKRSDESGVGGRVLSALLNEIDGVSAKSKVVVIATTNALNLVDSALTRPGRFDRLIEIPNPSEDDRIEMFTTLKNKTPVKEDVDIVSLAKSCNGMTCSEIQSFFRFAALKALREGQSEVSTPYFEEGKKRVEERRVALKNVKKYL
ncbi:ATPase, AAA family protein [Trichomonas vaginalis G3]|uniref:ATPase, AAA family protein n=1 Tax=Trichomonas vaginalis (strain ATCC PRA-98 / G3) TaxID=412133 RepID=A2E6U3_TRIV3|nr:ATP binding [Trichomonas vaginalis G3]EAY11579.1 ATPase, AAA family protein [Trichomonas vaginalis G3]KAI5516538.1 ATP binding [Trichomonas vaginalis G3]|eukprot:XP_001323802.1 ATPase, AAA family protein [Trichomonas vaginalis G3]